MSKIPARLCVGCRKMKPRDELIRLTVDYTTGEVTLNQDGTKAHGRSAYLCLSEACFIRAQKGTRLRQALEGRRLKPKKRGMAKRFGKAAKTVSAAQASPKIGLKWPLEPQLIKVVSELCAEHSKNMPKY